MNNQTVFLEKVHDISNALSSGGVKHWLFRGTLLGAVRNNALLPNAKRIHFCYMENEFEETKGKNERIVSIIEKVGNKHGLSSVTMETSRNGLRLITGYKLTGGKYDIEFHACTKNKSDLIPILTPGMRYKYYYVDELELIEIERWALPCPRYRHKLCALFYGEDWRLRVGREEYFSVALSNGMLKNLGSSEGSITGYAEGVFDLFHIGHLNLFKRGKMLYDRFLVGVETDEGVTYKRKPIIPYEQRLEIVKACRYVDGVIERPPDALRPDFLEKRRTLAFYRQHNIDYELAGRSSDEFFKEFYSDIVGLGILHLVERTDITCTSDIVNNIRQQIGLT